MPGVNTGLWYYLPHNFVELLEVYIPSFLLMVAIYYNFFK